MLQTGSLLCVEAALQPRKPSNVGLLADSYRERVNAFNNLKIPWMIEEDTEPTRTGIDTGMGAGTSTLGGVSVGRRHSTMMRKVPARTRCVSSKSLLFFSTVNCFSFLKFVCFTLKR